jgi:hypothetical protein
MLSKTCGRLVVFSVKWTSFCCGMPYSWDERRGQIRITRKSWKKWAYLQQFTFLIGILSCIKLIFTFSSPSSTQYDKLRRILSTAIYLIPGIFAVNTWRCHLELACFINAYIKFSQHFRSKNYQ